MLRKMCGRAPLLGIREVSVRSTKSRVCQSRSETMSFREEMLEPAFCVLRVKKESSSEGSAPWVGGWGGALCEHDPCLGTRIKG